MPELLHDKTQKKLIKFPYLLIIQKNDIFLIFFCGGRGHMPLLPPVSYACLIKQTTVISAVNDSLSV